MAGLVPAIHVFIARSKQVVDARDKRGHDVERMEQSNWKPLPATTSPYAKLSARGPLQANTVVPTYAALRTVHY